jgi:exportin-1
LIAAANQNADVLNNPDHIKQMANIMKTNVAACSSIGGNFIVQIARIYMDMLNVFRATSELISRSVAEGGTFQLFFILSIYFTLYCIFTYGVGLIQTKTPRVRGLRTIKKEILKLIQTYIMKAEELQVVVENLVPPLMDAVLGDYHRNVEPARDAEVLTLMTCTVQKLGVRLDHHNHGYQSQPLMTDYVPTILEAVFECTLNMINKDFQEYPEHRVAFFNLLRAIDQNCFQCTVAYCDVDHIIL